MARAERQGAGRPDAAEWRVAAMEPEDAEEVDRFGPHGKVVLDPEGGPALEAKRNGRYGLLIHGGRLSPAQRLRPTYGCLRVADADMARLVTHHRTNPITRCIRTGRSNPHGMRSRRTGAIRIRY